MGSYVSTPQKSFDQQSSQNFNKMEKGEKHMNFEERQPRPEARSPPKVFRREQPLNRTNGAIATTNSSGTFVPIAPSNALVPSTNTPVQSTPGLNLNPTQIMPSSYNFLQSTMPMNNPYAPPNQQAIPSNQMPMNNQGVRLPTPPVTSTVAPSSNAMFRPSSATLTEICSSDDEEHMPVQKPAQTSVFNYAN